MRAATIAFDDGSKVRVSDEMAAQRKTSKRKAAAPKEPARAATSPYLSFTEHLHDELDRLALLLELHIARARPAQGAEPDDAAIGSEAALAAKEESIARRVAASSRKRIDLPLVRLCEAFGLTAFERDVFLAALAPTVDGRFADLYARLHENPDKRYLTAELILDLLGPDPVARTENVARLHPRGALLEWKLLHVEGASEPASTSAYLRPLLVDLHVLRLVLGAFGLHPSVARLVRVVGPREEQGDFADAVHAQVERLGARLAEGGRGSPTWVHLRTPDADEAADIAAASAKAVGLRVFEIRASELVAIAAEGREALTETLRLLSRDARFYRAALLLTGADELGNRSSRPEEPRHALLRALVDAAPLVFLAGSDDALEAEVRRALRRRDFRWIDLTVPASTSDRRLITWERSLASIAGPSALPHEALAALAARYELTTGQIRRAAASAVDRARARPAAETALQPGDLRAGVRTQTRRMLGDLATRVTARHRWDDLVLSEGSLGQLHEICAHQKERHTVLGTWGFGERLQRGLGIHALFCGPPGTGKTMAASIVAEELDLELYRIDLSLVINKYVGETEKNLGRVFREAASAPVILFFDEADALFAKRTKVEDSHDRYANLETGYLLQRIEDHPGITILATNLSDNLDQAFLRRMAFIIDFPFPDAGSRKRILEKLFPKAAPVADDLDLSYLGERFQLAGGNLRNVALRAAFTAADRREPIGMAHLLQAAKREYEKLGKPFLPSDFAEYLAASSPPEARAGALQTVVSPFARKPS